MKKYGLEEQNFGVMLLKRLNSKSYADLGTWVSFFLTITGNDNNEELKKYPSTIYGYGNLDSPISEKIAMAFEENRSDNIRNLSSIFSDVYHGRVMTEIEQIPNTVELNVLANYTANHRDGVKNKGDLVLNKEFRDQVLDTYKGIGKRFYEKLKPLEHTIYFWFELVYICISGDLEGHQVPFLCEFDSKKVVSDKFSYDDVREFVDLATRFGVNSSIGKRELNAIWENRSQYYNNPLLLKEAADLNYFSETYNGFLLSFELYERALYRGNINAAYNCFWNSLYMGTVTKDSFDKMLKEKDRPKGSYKSIEINSKEEAPETYYRRMRMALTYLLYGASKGDGICYNSLGNCVGEIERVEDDHPDMSDEARKDIKECLSMILDFISCKEEDSFEEIKLKIYEKGVEYDNPNSYVNSSYILIDKLQGCFKALEDNNIDEKVRKTITSDIKTYINKISERLDIAATRHKLPEAAHTIARFLQGKKKSKSDTDCIYCMDPSVKQAMNYEGYLEFFKKSYFFQKTPKESDMLKKASRYAYSGGLSTFSAKQRDKCIEEYRIILERLKEIY